MQEKFNLRFTILDAKEVVRIQRQIGIDTNPWSAIPKIITSMDYLRQPSVRNKFELSAQSQIQINRRVWDLLIVDEAHNFAPNTYSSESLRTQMLRDISKWFEHRLFLTATPHNGYTFSYTGLLELLDPLKFHKSPVMNEVLRENIKDVVIRRLKSDFIDANGKSYFTEREVLPLNIDLAPDEIELFNLVNMYKDELLKRKDEYQSNASHFIFTLLIKRLLSSTFGFARTWWTHITSIKEALEEGESKVSKHEVSLAINRTRVADLSDEAREEYEKTALSLASFVFQESSEEAADIVKIRKRISKILEKKMLGPRVVALSLSDVEFSHIDTKIASLRRWIEDNLQENKEFRDDEKLIIFTEYKDTQHYIVNILENNYKITDPEVAILHGSTDKKESERIKQAFNNPLSEIKILIATDTASEGLNLQYSCRYVIHYDIPWNPAKLEQRNGRVDRHGQSRLVKIFHFASEQSEDMKLLGKVASKVNSIQDDLGSVGQILADVVTTHFNRRVNFIDDVYNVTPQDFHGEKKEEKVKRIKIAESYYKKSMEEIGITSKGLSSLFSTAFEKSNGIVDALDDTTLTIRKIPATWEKLVEGSLRRKTGIHAGRIPNLAFDGDDMIVEEFGRRVFRNLPDKELITLGHPLMQRTLTNMKKLLWDTLDQNALSRWIITKQEGSNAIFIFDILLTIRNELGEILHSEFFTTSFKNNGTWSITEKPEFEYLRVKDQLNKVTEARKLWVSSKLEIIKKLETIRDEKVESIVSQLKTKLKMELKLENERYKQAKSEVETRKTESSLKELQKQLDKMKEKYRQMSLDPVIQAQRSRELDDMKKRVEEIEWRKKNQDYLKLLLEEIDFDHKLMVEEVLPKRYSNKETVEFYPLGTIICLPAEEWEA